MSRLLGVALGALAIMSAAPASATVYEISVTGTLNSSLGMSSPDNTGVDANLGVGLTLTMKARFSDERALQWGDSGYLLTGLYGLPTSGEALWRVEGGGLTWTTTDDLFDGTPWFSADMGEAGMLDFGGPGFLFKEGKLNSIIGNWMFSASSSDRPIIAYGNHVPDGYRTSHIDENGEFVFDEYYEPITSDPASQMFQILPPGGLYGNYYGTPGFVGSWDLAGATVTIVSSVPEPATWAMMIVGFGVAGVALRRPRSVYLARV